MSCVTPAYDKEYKRQYYLKNRDKILEQTRKRTEENKESISARKKALHREDPRKLLLSLAKRRARSKGIEYNLTIADLIIPETCPILNIPIKVGEGKIADTSPSLDRIDNSKGYVKGNVQVISNMANRMKNSASPELLLKFAEWVLRSNMKIVVYSKDNCHACTALKARLTREGESFTEINVGKDMTREDFLAKFPQVRQMPHVEFINEE